MAFDPHINLLSGRVQIAPIPATTGEVFTLMPGDVTRFQPNMPVTVFPPNVEMPTRDNAEIGYVRAISGNDLTITRAQEGSLHKSVAAGWQIIGE